MVPEVNYTCAETEYPALRILPIFAPTTADVPPAHAVERHAYVSPAALRAVAAAVYTAGDAFATAWYTNAQQGLYGGSWTWAGAGYRRITLSGLRWTSDLAVSGTITIDYSGNNNLIQVITAATTNYYYCTVLQ